MVWYIVGGVAAVALVGGGLYWALRPTAGPASQAAAQNAGTAHTRPGPSPAEQAGEAAAKALFRGAMVALDGSGG